MQNYHRKIKEAAAFIHTRIKEKPKIGVLTGTGLGDSGRSMSISATLAYEDIPHCPVSTVAGHFGKLLFGRMAGMPVWVMQGRFHLYEGYSPLEVTFPIRVMRNLGIDTLILTNASGGLNPEFSPGDLMIISDHINLTGENPLVGPNREDWGERFPDMSAAYDGEMISLTEDCCRELGILYQKGVYAGLKGPSLETPAEVRFLKTIGAEAVGFSTVLEVIAAVHAGMRVLGLSVITNVHDPDRPVPASVAEIIDVAMSAAPMVDRVINRIIQKS